jgi:predicted dehydrogenase
VNHSKISRRQLLKTTTTAGTALFTALSYKNVQGANDRVRVGLIGIGLIGKRHLLDFMAQPDVEITAICEVYEPRLREGITTSGARAEGFKDFRKMLDRKSVDAVVISTPDHWHALLTILACAAGKDVYVEKPLTHVVQEGRWMIETAKYHNRVVQVGTQQRSGEHYKKCVQLIHEGHIGEVRNARISAFRNITPGFTTPVGSQPLSEEDWNMWLGPAPYIPFEKYRCIYHFRWFWDYSGGQTTNLLSHDLDIVQWTMDSVPKRVTAMGARYSLKGIGETPDVCEAVFEYPEFLASWSNREVSGPRSDSREGLEICGTRGTLLINRGGFEVFPDLDISPEDQIPQFTSPRRTRSESSPRYRTTALKGAGYQEVKDQFQPHVRNFLDCVKSRQQPVSDLEGGHKTATSCHLANISMKVGRTLRWNAEREEIVGDAEAAKLLTKVYRAPWDQELKSAVPETAIQDDIRRRR